VLTPIGTHANCVVPSLVLTRIVLPSVSLAASIAVQKSAGMSLRYTTQNGTASSIAVASVVTVT